MKINAAYETGKFKQIGHVDTASTDPKAIQAGLALVDQTVESVTGVPIHYNVMLDFQAFRQAVSTVGGITVNVPEDLVDPTMAWENNNNPVLAKAGIQNFDGVHALIYVRSRETTSDFARAQRQRTAILALKEKVVSLGTLSNPIKIAGLINAFGDNVSTDLSLSDATRLYSITKDIPNDKVLSIGLADKPNSYVTTGPMNGQSIVLPRAGLFNYTDIQKYIRSQLKDGYITKENSRVLVLNGTTLPGLATTVSDELKTYGYNVTGTANAPASAYQQTVIVDLTKGRDKYTKHYLEQRFSTSAVSSLPDPTIQASGADFVIILGNDATTSSQN
jgi:LCP family protein required for cell wall assembly